MNVTYTTNVAFISASLDRAVVRGVRDRAAAGGADRPALTGPGEEQRVLVELDDGGPTPRLGQLHLAAARDVEVPQGVAAGLAAAALHLVRCGRREQLARPGEVAVSHRRLELLRGAVRRGHRARAAGEQQDRGDRRDPARPGCLSHAYYVSAPHDPSATPLRG